MVDQSGQVTLIDFPQVSSWCCTVIVSLILLYDDECYMSSLKIILNIYSVLDMFTYHTCLEVIFLSPLCSALTLISYSYQSPSQSLAYLLTNALTLYLINPLDFVCLLISPLHFISHHCRWCLPPIPMHPTSSPEILADLSNFSQ